MAYLAQYHASSTKFAVIGAANDVFTISGESISWNFNNLSAPTGFNVLAFVKWTEDEH
jgi:hypothetical protein